jgi:hypothetical protein
LNNYEFLLGAYVKEKATDIIPVSIETVKSSIIFEKIYDNKNNNVANTELIEALIDHISNIDQTVLLRYINNTEINQCSGVIDYNGLKCLEQFLDPEKKIPEPEPEIMSYSNLVDFLNKITELTPNDYSSDSSIEIIPSYDERVTNE